MSSKKRLGLLTPTVQSEMPFCLTCMVFPIDVFVRHTRNIRFVIPQPETSKQVLETGVRGSASSMPRPAMPGSDSGGTSARPRSPARRSRSCGSRPMRAAKTRCSRPNTRRAQGDLTADALERSCGQISRSSALVPVAILYAILTTRVVRSDPPAQRFG